MIPFNWFYLKLHEDIDKDIVVRAVGETGIPWPGGNLLTLDQDGIHLRNCLNMILGFKTDHKNQLCVIDRFKNKQTQYVNKSTWEGII